MGFYEQTLGGFIQARAAATEVLHREGLLDRDLNVAETLVLQAVAHVISEQVPFYSADVAKLAEILVPSYENLLGRFESGYGLTVSVREDPAQIAGERRHTRRLYTPTPFGQQVFGLFT